MLIINLFLLCLWHGFQPTQADQSPASAQQPNSPGSQANSANSNMAAMAQAAAQAVVAQAVNGSTLNSNQFIIKFFHQDSKNNLAYVSILPVNYTNLHEPRIELRYQSIYPYVSIDERSPNNSVVAAVVVNDEDSGPSGETNLSIEHGNELGHFKLVSTQFTNTIQVNGAPLSKHRVPEYNLTIVARDHGSPPKFSSVNLVIKLSASQISPTNAPLEPQSSSKEPVTDLIYVGLMLVIIFIVLIILIISGCVLVQRPKNKKGPPPRTTSSTNSRMHPCDHNLCLGHTNF